MSRYRRNDIPVRLPRWYEVIPLDFRLVILLALLAFALLYLALHDEPSAIKAEQDVADDVLIATVADGPYWRRKAAEERQAERIRKAYAQGRADERADGCRRNLGRPLL